MMLAWLILVPFIGGVLAGLAGRGANRNAPRYVCLLALAVEIILAISIWTGALGEPQTPGLFQLNAAWIPAIGASFFLRLDGLSLLMVILTAGMGILAILAAWKNGDGISSVAQPPSAVSSPDCVPAQPGAAGPHSGLFHFLLLWTICGMVGVFLAMDMLLLYFFWEMMVIPLYFLIGLWGGPQRTRAAIKMFLFAQVSGLLMLAASIYLALAHGRPYTFSYPELLQTPLSPAAATWIVLGLFAAFAVKLPAFGVHSWLPDAHEQSPESGAVDVAGLVVKVGAYGLLRFVVPLLPQAPPEFILVARVLAVAGIIYGGVLAFAQSDLKRFVGYVSVSHAGFILLGVMSLNETALQGVVMLILAGGIGTAALFIVVGAVHARTGRRELRYLGGLWKSMPCLGGTGMFFALAAMGLPLMGTFVGEVLVLAGTFQVSPVFAAIGAAGMVVSVIYGLWFVHKVFQGPPPSMEETDVLEHDLRARDWLMLAPAILAMLWLGVYPKPVLDISAPVVKSLLRAPRTSVSGQSNLDIEIKGSECPLVYTGETPVLRCSTEAP